MVILKFYVINTSDNLPFQPYFCNPHVISFQKMYILSVVQFMPKKMSATGLWQELSCDMKIKVFATKKSKSVKNQ